MLLDSITMFESFFQHFRVWRSLLVFPIGCLRGNRRCWFTQGAKSLVQLQPNLQAHNHIIRSNIQPCCNILVGVQRIQHWQRFINSYDQVIVSLNSNVSYDLNQRVKAKGVGREQYTLVRAKGVEGPLPLHLWSGLECTHETTLQTCQNWITDAVHCWDIPPSAQNTSWCASSSYRNDSLGLTWTTLVKDYS